MKYTLSEAAKATGKNKATIQRAIKSGKISASKNENGTYEIDPSELHRVYEAITQRVAQHKNATERNTSKSNKNDSLERIINLEKELAVLNAEKRGLEEQKEQLQDTVEDLRKRLDQSENRVTALLSGPEQKPKKRFWLKIFKP